MNRQTSAATKERHPVFRTYGWKAHRQRQILEAAFDEFAANGYAAARLDDIAKRARIAKGTIYLYFKNKALLFRAVVLSLVHPVRERITPSLPPVSDSAEATIRQLMSHQYAGFVRNERAREILRLVIAESSRFPELSRSYHREVIEPEIRALRRFVQLGIASGNFRKTTIADFPQLMVAPAVFGAVWILLLGKRPTFNLDAYEQAHLECVMRSLLDTDSPKASHEKRPDDTGEDS
jgi:AcrR family transcriptional regulator